MPEEQLQLVAAATSVRMYGSSNMHICMRVNAAIYPPHLHIVVHAHAAIHASCGHHSLSIRVDIQRVDASLRGAVQREAAAGRQRSQLLGRGQAVRHGALLARLAAGVGKASRRNVIRCRAHGTHTIVHAVLMLIQLAGREAATRLANSPGRLLASQCKAASFATASGVLLRPHLSAALTSCRSCNTASGKSRWREVSSAAALACAASSSAFTCRRMHTGGCR